MNIHQKTRRRSRTAQRNPDHRTRVRPTRRRQTSNLPPRVPNRHIIPRVNHTAPITLNLRNTAQLHLNRPALAPRRNRLTRNPHKLHRQSPARQSHIPRIRSAHHQRHIRLRQRRITHKRLTQTNRLLRHPRPSPKSSAHSTLTTARPRQTGVLSAHLRKRSPVRLPLLTAQRPCQPHQLLRSIPRLQNTPLQHLPHHRHHTIALHKLRKHIRHTRRTIPKRHNTPIPRKQQSSRRRNRLRTPIQKPAALPIRNTSIRTLPTRRSNLLRKILRTTRKPTQIPDQTIRKSTHTRQTSIPSLRKHLRRSHPRTPNNRHLRQTHPLRIQTNTQPARTKTAQHTPHRSRLNQNTPQLPPPRRQTRHTPQSPVQSARRQMLHLHRHPIRIPGNRNKITLRKRQTTLRILTRLQKQASPLHHPSSLGTPSHQHPPPHQTKRARHPPHPPTQHQAQTPPHQPDAEPSPNAIHPNIKTTLTHRAPIRKKNRKICPRIRQLHTTKLKNQILHRMRIRKRNLTTYPKQLITTRSKKPKLNPPHTHTVRKRSKHNHPVMRAGHTTAADRIENPHKRLIIRPLVLNHVITHNQRNTLRRLTSSHPRTPQRRTSPRCYHRHPRPQPKNQIKPPED